MTHTDYEEAICDNPALFIFPRLLVTVDGSYPSTCLTACLLWEQLVSQPQTSSHLGTFYTRPYFSPGTCIYLVHEWICKPISTCICCRGWEECTWLTLLTQGAEGAGQLLAPSISCVWWSWNGSKGTFGNTFPSGSWSNTEMLPCSFTRKD